MKKYISSFCIFLLSLFIFLCSFSGDKNIYDSSKQEINDSCEIIPYVGVGNIVLGKSNIRDVEKTFGKGIRKCHWQSRSDIEGDLMVRTINYPHLGLEFQESRAFPFSKFTVDVIELTDSCKCKTKMGNGIGSTLNDLRREFGSIRVIFWTGSENGKEKKWVNAYLTQESMDMNFNCYSTIDTTNFRVEEIEMTHCAGCGW